jgi:formylglycine-generating enzyme required for sulfatase activity
VGSHPEGDSPHGVKDLAGNLREWTSSRAAWGRVTKGGSYWDDKPEPVSAWHRSSAQDGSMLTGFRCARSL